MRLLMLSSVFLALSGAVLLYALNNETRALEARVQAQERQAARLRSDIAVRPTQFADAYTETGR